MAQVEETQHHQEVAEMDLKDEAVSAMKKKKEVEVEDAGDDLSSMPKTDKSENMEEGKKDYGFDSVTEAKVLLRYCSECGRQFTSGKALGGHKRACLQKNNQPKLTIAKKMVTPVRLDQDEGDGGFNCFVCKQSFRSLKSLYGHMRKHPEREWRGIRPPQEAINNNGDKDHGDESESSDDAIGSAVDLVESLKTWPVKVKRSYKSSSEPRFSTCVSEEEEEDVDSEAEAMQQAVNDLLLLAEHRSNKQLDSGRGVLKIKGDWVEKKTEILLEGELEKKNNNKRCNSEDTWSDNNDEENCEMELSRKTKLYLKKKKRRLAEFDDMDWLSEDEATVMAPQTYPCPICNKVFSKHQALGGHVASHNKNKNIIGAKESSTSMAASASEEGNGDNNVMENEKQTSGGGDNEHQCNICSKIFPTGQALGGHKRCHWTGPLEAFSSSSQVTTSAGEVTQSTRKRRLLDFDLNMTPPEYFQIYGGETAALH